MFKFIILFPTLIYFLSLISFLLGLVKKRNKKQQNSNNDISIIVCVRNGEFSIQNLLNDLKKQDYNGNLEFIILDDDSSDNSAKVIQDNIYQDKTEKSVLRFRYKYDKGYSITLNTFHY